MRHEKHQIRPYSQKNAKSGLVLLIVPGLCVFVICSLAMWYLFAQYSMSAEVQIPALVITDDVPLTL